MNLPTLFLMIYIIIIIIHNNAMLIREQHNLTENTHRLQYLATW